MRVRVIACVEKPDNTMFACFQFPTKNYSLNILLHENWRIGSQGPVFEGVILSISKRDEI